MVQPVPDVLLFEHALFKTTPGGRRQVDILEGQFDRQAGSIQITAPFNVRLDVEPVP